jgi:hypothetical protein
MALSELNGSLRRWTSHTKWKWYEWVSPGGGSLLAMLVSRDFLPVMLNSTDKLSESFCDRVPLGLWDTRWLWTYKRLTFEVNNLERSLNTGGIKERAVGFCVLSSWDVSLKQICFMSATSCKLCDLLPAPAEGESRPAGVVLGPVYLTGHQPYIQVWGCALFLQPTC